MKKQIHTHPKLVFTYFTDPEERSKIYIYVKRLALYLKSKEIKNIAFLDRSARNIWIGVNTYWSIHFKNYQKPKMYFFNPDGFNYNDCIPNFKQTFKKLTTEKDLSLAIFDTCAHSGQTFQNVIKCLIEMDFSRIVTITAKAPNKESVTKINYSLDKTKTRGCYPFGTVDLTSKEDNVVCERRRVSNWDRELGIQIRKEIREIARN